MKRKPPKAAEPSDRDKLSTSFMKAIEADFAANGVSVLEQLRLKSPEKYCEIAARLIAAIEPAPQGPVINSTADVGRQLLLEAGANEFEITDDMISQAIAAQEQLIVTLETIIASRTYETEFETADLRN